GVEHDTVGLVVSSDLEDVAPAHPAECHAIVEEQSARILLADSTPLQAAARKDEQLRIDWELQRLKRRLQVPAAAVERELDRPILEFLVQVGDDVVERRFRIVDCRVVWRPHEGTGTLGVDGRPHADKYEKAKFNGEKGSPAHRLRAASSL